MKPTCDDGWTKVDLVGSDKCFKVLGVGTAVNAYQTCKEQDAQLPVPVDKTESDRYAALIKAEPFKDALVKWSRMKTGIWLGLSDIETEGNLINMNTDKPFQVPSDINAKLDQDSADSDFIVLYSTNVWQDVQSNFRDINILCEKDPGFVKTCKCRANLVKKEEVCNPDKPWSYQFDRLATVNDAKETQGTWKSELTTWAIVGLNGGEALGSGYGGHVKELALENAQPDCAESGRYGQFLLCLKCEAIGKFGTKHFCYSV